jgi:hypothetical protein
LVIKTKEGYVTWGATSTAESVLWISASQFIPTGGELGYQVCETASRDATTTEAISFSANEILLNGVSFLDTGTSGDAVDPTELLYKGGESIVAETMEQKDNTLFLGNIKMTRPVLDVPLKNTIISGVSIEQDTRTFYPTKISEGGYAYSNQLTSFSDSERTNSVPCGGFKRGDYYRCGVQFQYKDGKWSDPLLIDDKPITNTPSIVEGTSVTVPALKGTISKAISDTLYDLGYRRARAVVVFPEVQDRVVLCQGVTCGTLYTEAHRTVNKNLYAQSSWFFRPSLYNGVSYINTNGTISPVSSGPLKYTNRGVDTNVPISGDTAYDPADIRMVEIQGDFNASYNSTTGMGGNRFQVDNSFITLHSPDLEFDDHYQVLDFTGLSWRSVGLVSFTNTLSDIDIQTETPTVSNSGSGFIHKSFSQESSHGIVSGLFYEDYSVNERQSENSRYEKHHEQRSPMLWLVYPWHRTGSLNNDSNRPSDKGTRTAMLKKKVISNLRIADTVLTSVGTAVSLTDTPQLFNSDQLSIVKVGNDIYQGNIDTLIVPDNTDGLYFAFGEPATTSTPGSDNIEVENIVTPFNSVSWWKTFSKKEAESDGEGLWKRVYNSNAWKWVRKDNKAGEADLSLVMVKDPVRMRYKSTAHLVLRASPLVSSSSTNISVLPVIELVRPGDDNSSFYRATMFGGTSKDAQKANLWIPCGEPIILGTSYNNEPTNGKTIIQYSYGDTYYQRWDCLKTYPFTNEDINQIVEIGSFMLETKVNIDGRYDRNRGQVNNTNMSPRNFNLLNQVYSQVNNFFTYRILDDAYYEISMFPNQITWTKEKQAGADVDLWTNVTLSSTYDIDGAKGSITSLNTWKGQLFCFQDKGISNILFNSRVQIPTSDGVPIEISNGYKVEGYRYISDGIGCINKWTISNTPSGIYFMDAVSNHLCHISDKLADITATHNMTSWFNNVEINSVVSTLYDDVNHDLYLVIPSIIENDTVIRSGEVLCYSEILGQFTSFLTYDRIKLLESYSNYVYTLRDGKLYFMFKGLYNDFFGVNKGWEFTFISNGVDNSTMDFDKIFSNIDYRMDIFEGNTYKPDLTLDYIRAVNEYQDTTKVNLCRLKVASKPLSYHHKGTNLQKKFRIWRIQIPRNNNSLDRIRNPWCKITLGSEGQNNYKAVLHDLNVQYYL